MRYIVAFLLPVIGVCIAFLEGKSHDYVLIDIILLLLAEYVVNLLYERLKNNAIEYISGYALRVEHYFPWVERVVKKESKRDSNGHWVTEKVVKYVNHPDEYVEVFNIDHVQNISAKDFHWFCRRWGTGLYSIQTDHKNCVEGGGGEACDWDEDENSTETITITHRYHNPFRSSNSLFRSRLIEEERAVELGLCSYPEIEDNQEQSVIMVKEGVDIPDDLDEALVALQRLNAFCGESSEIHVFILLFPASDGIGITAYQKDYWNGLNKNELLICLGMNGQKVQWCEAMSWMDDKTLELKIRSYFIHHPRLRLTKFVSWLRANLIFWNRKEFKDFDYLKKGVPGSDYWLFLFVSFLVSALLCYICFRMG